VGALLDSEGSVHAHPSLTLVNPTTGVLSPDDIPEPEFDRYWELKQGSGQITVVQGKLKLSAKFWKEVLQVPKPVLEWVPKGYELPLLSLPPPYFQRNQKSAQQNAYSCNRQLMNFLIIAVSKK